jgi:hypothetical protein
MGRNQVWKERGGAGHQNRGYRDSGRGETVPGKRMSMRKTREVLRLYFELRLRQRQIARSANVSQSTVHEYVERFGRRRGDMIPIPTGVELLSWRSGGCLRA